ncbi:MAG: STAS domain-containing protein [Acidobacteria bacterium]|nr:STAS domain-containing protein [Acidobacteriota bacterium]
MRIGTKQQGDVTVIDFEGRLALGDTEEELVQAIVALLQQGHRKILIDLSGIDYIDSNGLGELVHGFRAARDQGAVLKLLRPQDRVRQTLQLSMLLPLFEIYEDEEEALESFG